MLLCIFVTFDRSYASFWGVSWVIRVVTRVGTPDSWIFHNVLACMSHILETLRTLWEELVAKPFHIIVLEC